MDGVGVGLDRDIHFGGHFRFFTLALAFTRIFDNKERTDGRFLSDLAALLVVLCC